MIWHSAWREDANHRRPKEAQTMPMNPETPKFHVKDGWHFWRDHLGIHIEYHGDQDVTEVLVLNRAEWASLIAATTLEGESGLTFRLAEALIG